MVLLYFDPTGTLAQQSRFGNSEYPSLGPSDQDPTQSRSPASWTVSSWSKRTSAEVALCSRLR